MLFFLPLIDTYHVFLYFVQPVAKYVLVHADDMDVNAYAYEISHKHFP